MVNDHWLTEKRNPHTGEWIGGGPLKIVSKVADAIEGNGGGQEFDSSIPPETRVAVAEGMDAVKAVVGDVPMPRIVSLPPDDPATARALSNGDIGIHPDSGAATTASAVVHEMGHVLDRKMGGGDFFTQSEQGRELWQVLTDSPTVQGIRGDKVTILQGDIRTRNQMLQGREMFARAFEQYVAERADSPTLTKELASIRGNEHLRFQAWPDDEFQPIAGALDKLFEAHGLQNPLAVESGFQGRTTAGDTLSGQGTEGMGTHPGSDLGTGTGGREEANPLSIESGIGLPPGSRIVHTLSKDHEGEGFTQHTFAVQHEGRQIAMLTVNELPGGNVTESVETDPAFQRQGVASALYARAEKDLGPVEHSEWQTAAGTAWAGAVGGRRHGSPEEWTTEAPIGPQVGDRFQHSSGGSGVEILDVTDRGRTITYRKTSHGKPLKSTERVSRTKFQRLQEGLWPEQVGGINVTNEDARIGGYIVPTLPNTPTKDKFRAKRAEARAGMPLRPRSFAANEKAKAAQRERINVTSADKVPGVMYHVTKRDPAAIGREGLTIEAGRRAFREEPTAGFNPPGIYLYDDIATTRRLYPRSVVSVFRVDTEGVALEPDRWGGKGAYRSVEPIPPNRLTLVHTYQPFEKALTVDPTLVDTTSADNPLGIERTAKGWKVPGRTGVHPTEEAARAEAEKLAKSGESKKPWSNPVGVKSGIPDATPGVEEAVKEILAGKTAVSNLGRADLEREARNLGVARWSQFSLSDLRKAVRRARESEARTAVER